MIALTPLSSNSGPDRKRHLPVSVPPTTPRAGDANLSHRPTYLSWRAMNWRCHKPDHHNYRNYGGRGIVVCDRWRTFANFLADMGQRPEGSSIDRIDPDGNYEPNNCRWATNLEQRRNKRNAHRITLNGRQMYLAEVAAEYGLSCDALRSRLNIGWSIERAISTPVRFRCPKAKDRNETRPASYPVQPAGRPVMLQGGRNA